jgi:hypothetical protein
MALTLLASIAQAVQPSTNVTISVQSGSDSGSFTESLPITSNPFVFSLPAPVNIFSSTNPSDLLGTINTLDLTLNTDPTVIFNFSVTAGAAPANFTLSSGIVSFPPITNPLGFATAALTITDNGSDGATATGLFPGSKAYQAQYNGRSAEFANLVSPVTAAPQSSNTGSERFPAFGSAPLVPPVNDIESQFSFSLTATDGASGTSRFTVTPEPSSITLALLGALGLAWSIRRRLLRS